MGNIVICLTELRPLPISIYNHDDVKDNTPTINWGHNAIFVGNVMHLVAINAWFLRILLL